MKLPTLSITLPVAPNQIENWRRFCQELLGARRNAYEASRRRLGITRERFSLVQTPTGTAVRVTLEAEDVGEAISRLAASGNPFDQWLKERLRAMHGVSFSAAEPRQGTEPIFEWPSARKGGESIDK
jgi:hypothetical protein